MAETVSNQILFHIIIEDRFCCPAGGEEGLADEVLDVGGDGAYGTEYPFKSSFLDDM